MFKSFLVAIWRAIHYIFILLWVGYNGLILLTGFTIRILALIFVKLLKQNVNKILHLAYINIGAIFQIFKYFHIKYVGQNVD